MLDRRIKPHPTTPRTFHFPDWSVKELDNGMKVVLQQDSSLPLISIQVMLSFGSTIDYDLPGIASVTAVLLSRGTKKRNDTQLFEDTASLGAALYSSCGWDYTQISISGLSKNTEDLLDMLAESLFEPSFSPSQFDFVIEQRLNSLTVNKDSTDYLAASGIEKTLFPNHPYGLPSTGTEESLKKMTRDDVVRFYETNYHALDSYLIISGDIADSDALFKKVNTQFSSWKSGKERVLPTFTLPTKKQTEVVLIHKPDAVQSSIKVVHYGIDRNNLDLPKIRVMNTMFGGYFGSRLNLNIREEKGYTYGVGSAFSERKNVGYFAVSTQVRNEVTGAAVQEILLEMSRIKKELITDKELDMVKNYLIGRFPLKYETINHISGAIMEILFYQLPKNYPAEFRDALGKVTKEDVLEMANKYLHPECCAIIVAGNATDVFSQLKTYGDIQLYDQDMKTIQFEKLANGNNSAEPNN